MNIRRKHLYSLLFIPLLISLISCQTSQQLGVNSEKANENTPQNIIFLIGDGMSFPQITAAEYKNGPLRMTSLPHSGLVTTYSANSKVTDSAAGATALAAGYKTNNGMLGVLPDGTPVESIAQYATELGKTTALVASSSITHATPAGFGIHHDDRGEEHIIAEKFVESDIDILMGAGSDFFLPESKGGTRSDDRNLISEMEEKGYYYTDNEEGLSQISDQGKVVVFLEGKELAPAPERGDQLVRLTKAALETASQNTEGFFMMVEGSQIDWAGHDNDGERVVEEMIDFDAVVSTVMDFAEQDENTLVVISADHETGGLTMLGAEEGELKYKYTTGGHTALDVPVFSYGPKGEIFEGRYDNTGIAKKLFEVWGKTTEK